MTDTINASVVTDHPFIPDGAWFNQCKHEGCGLSEAAHRETTIQPFGGFPPATYRCPDCVTKDIKVCTHSQARRGELPAPDAPDLPRWSGELCARCDSEMVRTGTCLTCPSCGDTSGCG